MKKAGCWAILFGAESGVQKNLNTMKKGIKLDQTRAAVKAAKKAGLKVYTPFIIGIPGETYEEALQTIDFAIELDPHYANFHSMTPFPGTELYENIERVRHHVDGHRRLHLRGRRVRALYDDPRADRRAADAGLPQVLFAA